MKKTLALVLAFALVFSTITVAFAEDAAAISADAKVCADLGMLVGDGNGVTTAYTATAPTRIQAAVMVLRLKGLEADAKAFTGTENFADADKAAWAKPIMAYLKAHPELGWAGDGKNFDPAGAMTAQAYYKVMLESLGYKQNTATVVGDFAWEKVLEFAATKGLTKAAAVTNFTVADLATATVETLKANVKDSTKTLVATLVEAGKVDKAKATAAGVYTEAAATTAELDSVIATANDKMEVTFSADVDKTFAENVANYKVVVKGSTTALEVKSAKAVGTTMVELATAAQTGGTAYTLTVGTVSKNFAGLAKNAATPEIDTVTCIDTNVVEVIFKKAMDRTSVEDIANYTLNNGATVKKAELWIDQDDSRKTVKLTTEGVAKNKVYKLKVANVKSADLVAIKTVEKSFAGVTDTTAPKLTGNVVVANNQRIFVVFDDAHGVDQASVENIANWSIDGLKINKITAYDYKDYGANNTRYGVADDYGYYDMVVVDTEPMTANHKYTVTISNLIDGSTAKNAISKALTKTFYGVAVDKTAPKVGQTRVYGDNIVEIDFTEANRLNVETATNVSNYTFNEGLQVLSAKLLRSSDLDHTLARTVVLTTSTMDKDTTYKLTVENVADEFGNVMTKVSNRSLPRSTGADIAPPAVTKVVWVDKNDVSVYFELTDRLDPSTTNDPANYVISGGIGAVRDAAVSSKSGYTRVDLTTPDLENNKSYTITISGVKDRAGNEMSSYKAYFVSSMTSADTDRPEIDNIVALNNKEIRVTFSEPVNATGAAMTFHRGAANYTATVQGQALPNFTIDDNTTAVFVVDSAAPQDVLADNDEYTIDTLSNVKDLHNNVYVVDTGDKPTFYGNTDADEAPEVVAIDQVDVKTLKVTFDKPVYAPATITAGGKTFDATVDVDDDETTDALSTITLDGAGKIALNTEFDFDFSTVTDYVGTASSDDSYKYTAYLEDKDNPVIDYVEAVSTAKVQVHFNESIDIAGSYNIKGVLRGATATTTSSVTGTVDADDDTIVNLNVSGIALDPGVVYTLTPKTSAYDIAGNKLDLADVSFDFVASSVVNNDYIKGVKVIDGRTIEVYTTKAYNTDNFNRGGYAGTGTDTIKVYVSDDNTEANLIRTSYRDVSGETTEVSTDSIIAGVSGNGTKTLKIYLAKPLAEDVTYTVKLNNSASLKYSFDGIVTDGGIDKTAGYVVTFSGWNVTNYVVKVVYNNVDYIVLPVDTADADAVIDTFDLDAANLIVAADGTDAGFDVADFAAHTVYTVEVYRTTETLDLTGITTRAQYNGVINNKVEATPYYSADFTR